MSKYQTKCDVCDDEDRLHQCDPGEWGNHGEYEVEDTILICDDCFEERTGFIAGCEDYCSLPLDHNGVCRER